jgi:hypothetical protein
MRDTLPLTEIIRDMSEEHSRRVIILTDPTIKTEQNVHKEVLMEIVKETAEEKDAQELVKGHSHSNAVQVAAVMAVAAGAINRRVQITKLLLLPEAKSLKRKSRLNRLNIRRMLIPMLQYVLINILQMQVSAHAVRLMSLSRQVW